MPLPTAILFTVTLFTAIMVAIGWWLEPTAPAFGPWFLAKITDGGLWTGLILFLLAVGYFTWRDGRTGTKPEARPDAGGPDDPGPRALARKIHPRAG